ncbi:MAG: hypothetical protein IPJ65_34510 [Archangiaceae bacterium]|nr:hypothetical protein [Archangiaceae bacterium]
MIAPKCERHRAHAGWKCQGCKKVLCPRCVATRRVHMATELEVCLNCGALADRLTQHRAEARSFAARLPRALVWPLSQAGFIAMAGVALVRAGLSYAPGLGWLVGTAAFAAFCLGLVRSSARGSDDFESLDFSDFVADVVMPGLKVALGAAIVWVPAVIRIGVLGDGGFDLQRAATDPVMWLLLLLGGAYAPMAIIVGASGGSLLGMLNPLHVVRTALRLGAPYLLAVGWLAALFVPWVVTLGVGALLNKLPIVFVPRLLDYMLACYVPFVGARVLGLLLYTHGDRIEYGLDSDYRVPLLAGAAPEGELPEPAAEAAQAGLDRHAPIELEPLPAEPVSAQEEAREARRLKELDPATLPPLKTEE